MGTSHVKTPFKCLDICLGDVCQVLLGGGGPGLVSGGHQVVRLITQLLRHTHGFGPIAVPVQ